nr:hypothetical protein [Tanacetum cinerariifolium]
DAWSGCGGGVVSVEVMLIYGCCGAMMALTWWQQAAGDESVVEVMIMMIYMVDSGWDGVCESWGGGWSSPKNSPEEEGGTENDFFGVGGDVCRRGDGDDGAKVVERVVTGEVAMAAAAVAVVGEDESEGDEGAMAVVAWCLLRLPAAVAENPPEWHRKSIGEGVCDYG